MSKKGHNKGYKQTEEHKRNTGRAVTGNKNGMWKESVPFVCPVCGITKYYKPWEAKNRKYCSFECYCLVDSSEETRIKLSKSLTKEKVPFTCQQCGKVKYEKPSVAKRRKFCSKECKYAYGHSEKTKEILRQAALKQFEDGMPQEIKDKIRKNNIGKNSGVNHFLFGKKQPEEVNEKNRQAQLKRFKEYPVTDETRKKLSKAQLKRLKDGLPEETKIKISKTLSGKYCEEDSNQWKGSDVGYFGLHVWVIKHLGQPTKCEYCGIDGLTGHKIHWANKDHSYKRNLDDWIRLCAKCHRLYDIKLRQ